MLSTMKSTRATASAPLIETRARSVTLRLIVPAGAASVTLGAGQDMPDMPPMLMQFMSMEPPLMDPEAMALVPKVESDPMPPPQAASSSVAAHGGAKGRAWRMRSAVDIGALPVVG
jgi:hypothetical protein